MSENFEFSDAKQVRKTLLITSFVGICFKLLVKNSVGEIEFLGFKIPVEDASIIPKLVGYMVIYEILVLIIRYSDENFKILYKKQKDHINNSKMPKNFIETLSNFDAKKRFFINPRKVEIIKYGLIFIDIIFPILLGIISLYIIFINRVY